MKDEEENIPLFVQDYLDKMDYEGYADFVKLSRDYHKEREEYPGKYAEQAIYLNDFNRRTGQNRQLNYDDGLKEIDIRHQQKAYDTAKQHGFKGADPNQPMDDDFTKQGEKFQGMIEEVKDREQQLVAFLEQIKQIREQQTQQQDEEPEI